MNLTLNSLGDDESLLIRGVKEFTSDGEMCHVTFRNGDADEYPCDYVDGTEEGNG